MRHYDSCTPPAPLKLTDPGYPQSLPQRRQLEPGGAAAMPFEEADEAGAEVKGEVPGHRSLVSGYRPQGVLCCRSHALPQPVRNPVLHRSCIRPQANGNTQQPRPAAALSACGIGSDRAYALV